jgi:hypothetical protein
MRLARQTRFPALLAVAALAALALLAPTAGAQSTARCTGAQLTGKVRRTSGAAGTAAASIAIRNISDQTCTLRGFPRLKLRKGSGPLPTRVRHGGLAILERPVTTVTIAPGKRASLLVAWSTVPTGAETSCPHATRLVIFLRLGNGKLSIPFSASPCNHGLLRESPFLSGLRPV